MMIKIRSLNVNLLTLLSVLFFLGAILFGIFAATGVVIVVTFMFKVFAFLSLVCLVIAVALFFMRKKVKVTEVKTDG
jgi:hypothetical protein